MSFLIQAGVFFTFFTKNVKINADNCPEYSFFACIILTLHHEK